MARDITDLKTRYQTTIQKLLNCPNYPGISFQQLEQFKQNFRSSAFTCRLWSCPYAALGFNNIGSLTRHEADHSKHVCRVQGCQYPVFTSARLLKNHVAEQHTSRDQELKRSSIRKRPALGSSSGPDDTPHKIEALEGDFHRIKCICNYSVDDRKTIYCVTCDTWQHIGCFYPNNWEEVVRADFSHSCVDCKPRPVNWAGAAMRMARFSLPLSDLESIAGNPKRPSRKKTCSHPLTANMPRQAAPRMAQASLPPNMMHQNSQVGSQMTMNDLIIENRTSLQDSETQAMPLQIQRHQHQQIATTLQNSGQQEGRCRPLITIIS